MDAYNEANLLFVEMSNKQPNLFKSELISQALTQGTATYVLPNRVVMILIAYIETGSGSDLNDRVLSPISTFEYASYANKVTQGVPSVYWLNRLATPEITFWQPPDASSTYTVFMRVVSQMQDANLPSGETPDLPYLWLDAFVAGLSHRLARIHKPELEQIRKADYDSAWAIAATQNVENVALNIIPGLESYRV